MTESHCIWKLFCNNFESQLYNFFDRAILNKKAATKFVAAFC